MKELKKQNLEGEIIFFMKILPYIPWFKYEQNRLRYLQQHDTDVNRNELYMNIFENDKFNEIKLGHF